MQGLCNATLPSWERYKSLFFKESGLSVLRILQYESISKIALKGKLLDFGGGAKAKYLSRLQYEDYESANIDPQIKPTWLVSVGERLPCPDHHYDTVLSLNTFEHIYNVPPVIEDLYRVLKPGGVFYFAVPFLYPVHGHPDDFCRYTASWWLQNLNDAGFQDVKITPHFWGPFSSGATCSGLPGPLRRLRLHAAVLLDLIYAFLAFGKGETTYANRRGTYLQNHALGYFVEAKK